MSLFWVRRLMHSRWLVVGMALVAASAEVATSAPKVTAPKVTARKAEPIAPLVTALWGADVEGAAKAAEQLGAMDVASAHDALLDALAFGLPAAVTVPAISGLTVHPAPADVTMLQTYARHRNPTIRSAALGALATYPDPKARQAVVTGLHDPMGLVRSAAAGAAAKGRVRESVEALFALLAKGEQPAARALAQMADPDLARKIAEQLGQVPDASLALCLGLVLKRPDFGPDAARVDIVRSIAKIQDASAVAVLSDYIDATPKNPPRPSRHEAEMVVSARLGGGGK